ncbi:MAG: mannitol dehydrogenase family protein [Paracoccaceae bacterium]
MSITPILQFGTSRFLQAHADLFISEAMERGDALGPVAVVQSSGDAGRSKRLAALAAPGGFPVRIEGLDGGRHVRHETRVTSVIRALSTATDWPEICRIAIEEARVILSNTADSGWIAQPQDAAPEFDQQMSYPAKLTHLLGARFRAGGPGLTVLPTELVARNGDRLRRRVLDIAHALDPALANWIEGEVIFGNSLVDRIVSEPLEPAGAVAEPYALWAIEAHPGLTLPCRHPAVRLVPDLDRIEKLKLHILNLGHSYLVAGWLSQGGEASPLVRDRLADRALRDDLETLYRDEVLPVFAAAGYGVEAVEYVATTLDRFANPFLDHKLSDIAQNHAEKVRRRIGALLDWARTLGVDVAAPRLRMIVAGQGAAA